MSWSRTQINQDPADLCNVITMVMLQDRQTCGRMGRRNPAYSNINLCQILHNAIRQSGPFQILQSCALCACAKIRACSPPWLDPGRPGLSRNTHLTTTIISNPYFWLFVTVSFWDLAQNLSLTMSELDKQCITLLFQSNVRSDGG